MIKYVVYGKHKVRPTCSGSNIKIEYKRVNDPDGSWHLEESGKTDIQKMINSSAPPSMSDVVRHASRGDFSLLNARDGGVYADVSQIHSLGEVYLMNEKAKAELAKVEKNKAKNATAKVEDSEVKSDD